MEKHKRCSILKDVETTYSPGTADGSNSARRFRPDGSIAPAHGETIMDEKWKIVELYNAVSNMMAHLGMEGEIDTRSPFVDDVMTALHRVDGGECSGREIEELLSRIENG